MIRRIEFVLNGQHVEVETEPHVTLLELLRDKFGLTGTKKGCGYGECGACTVLMDGKAVNSCLILSQRVQGKKITTIEGLSKNGELHLLQKKFVENGAIQCGYCTPGMILSAKALLDENPNPSKEDVKLAIVGNLCRCTGYLKIIEAILAAQQERLMR